MDLCPATRDGSDLRCRISDVLARRLLKYRLLLWFASMLGRRSCQVLVRGTMNFKSANVKFLLVALTICIFSSDAVSQAGGPQKPATAEQNPSNVRSKISIYDLESKSVRVVYEADKLWEAPNWSAGIPVPAPRSRLHGPFPSPRIVVPPPPIKLTHA